MQEGGVSSFSALLCAARCVTRSAVRSAKLLCCSLFPHPLGERFGDPNLWVEWSWSFGHVKWAVLRGLLWGTPMMALHLFCWSDRGRTTFPAIQSYCDQLADDVNPWRLTFWDMESAQVCARIHAHAQMHACTHVQQHTHARRSKTLVCM